MTDNDTLRTLWELLDEGRHQAWAKNEYGKPLVQYGEILGKSYWEYRFGAGPSGAYPLPVKDLYAIVRDSVEGWLVEEGWETKRAKYVGEYITEYWYNRYREDWRRFDTLTDAVRYAREQEKECPASANGRNM